MIEALELIRQFLASKLSTFKKIILGLTLIISIVFIGFLVDSNYLHSELSFIKTKSETVSSLTSNINDTTIDKVKREMLKRELDQVMMFHHYRNTFHVITKYFTDIDYLKLGLLIILYIITIGWIYLSLAAILWYSYMRSKKLKKPYGVDSPKIIKMILVLNATITILSILIPPYEYFSATRIVWNLIYSVLSLIIIVFISFSLPERKTE